MEFTHVLSEGAFIEAWLNLCTINNLIDKLQFISHFLFECYSVLLCFTSLKEDGSGSAYDKESMAIIKLNNTTVLYLKEVTKFLALVCILREESFERKGKLSDDLWSSAAHSA